MRKPSLKNTRLAQRRAQGLQSPFHLLPSELLFRTGIQRRIAQRMGNTHARHHPRNADGLCYGSDSADLRRGNTGPFQFLGDRCAATSARASGGGENHPLHIILFQGIGNGRAEAPAVFKGSAVARGGIDIIGHLPHPAFAHQGAQRVHRH